MSHASKTQLIKSWLFFAPLFVVLLISDQVTKWWASTQLLSNDAGKIGFQLSHNPGIAFGIDLPIWLILLMSAVTLGLGAYLVYEEKLWRDKWHLSALALLLAGAIGNIIDRVRFGYVIDFIKVYWWPNFNLADAWIVIAVALFFYEFMVREDSVSKI